MSKAIPAGPASSLLQRTVFGLDAWVRQREAIFEFTPDPNCIFRIQIDQLMQDLALLDGTSAREGDRIINLHLWNEQLPPLPKHGASIGWARRMARHTQRSLRALTQHLLARSELADIGLVGGTIAFCLPERHAQLDRVCRRLGFEEVSDLRTMTLARRAHRLGGNVLTSLITIALDGDRWQRSMLRRDRTQLFISRRRLERIYGTPVTTAATARIEDGRAA